MEPMVFWGLHSGLSPQAVSALSWEEEGAHASQRPAGLHLKHVIEAVSRGFHQPPPSRWDFQRLGRVQAELSAGRVFWEPVCRGHFIAPQEGAGGRGSLKPPQGP